MTQEVPIIFGVLLEFRGLTQHVGATLVVALDWAGTRPTPPYANTPQNPKEPFFYNVLRIAD
jgi:hypothetical protein